MSATWIPALATSPLAASLALSGAVFGACSKPASEQRPAPAAATSVPATAALPVPAPTIGDKPHAQAELLATAGAVAPGQPLMLAARIKVAPGWHLYWENPGESGLATRMLPAAPAGFLVGPVRYPGPERFESPGPIVSYGYPGETILFSEITAPASLPAQQIAFTAHLSWLACKESCVPGKADLALSLPVAKAAATPPAPAGNAAALSPYLSRLPLPLADLPGAQLGGDPDRPRLQLTALPGHDIAGQDAEVFPATGVEVTVLPADATKIRQFAFHRAADATALASLGVLRIRNRPDGTVKYYALSTPAHADRPNPL